MAKAKKRATARKNSKRKKYAAKPARKKRVKLKTKSASAGARRKKSGNRTRRKSGAKAILERVVVLPVETTIEVIEQPDPAALIGTEYEAEVAHSASPEESTDVCENAAQSDGDDDPKAKPEAA